MSLKDNSVLSNVLRIGTDGAWYTSTNSVFHKVGAITKNLQGNHFDWSTMVLGNACNCRIFTRTLPIQRALKSWQLFLPFTAASALVCYLMVGL